MPLHGLYEWLHTRTDPKLATNNTWQLKVGRKPEFHQLKLTPDKQNPLYTKRIGPAYDHTNLWRDIPLWTDLLFHESSLKDNTSFDDMGVTGAEFYCNGPDRQKGVLRFEDPDDRYGDLGHCTVEKLLNRKCRERNPGVRIRPTGSGYPFLANFPFSLQKERSS